MINCSSFLSASIQNHTKKQTGCGFSTFFLTRACSRLILGITAMIVTATMVPYQAKAQATWVPTGIGHVCDTASGFVRYDGRVGIRTNPSVPLHIHSSYCATGTTKIYPAIERLQTESTYGTYNFGQSAIQFWSGGITTGQDWAVAAIKPISNAIPQKFNTGDTTSPDNWLGGLAFYCSALGQRPTGGEIEVMRIVDEKVGIRTQTPLGQLDVNVGTANYHLPKISFTSGATSADATPGPQIRLYSPYGDPYDTNNVDRTSSYSWYIQSIRQYNPMCFSGVYGRNDGTSITTTMGALHFRAGYNTAAQKLVEDSSHNSGDIYRDDIGKESTVARMSLLSNGNVGINNEVPMARFQVTNGAVLFDGDTASTPLKRVVTWINDTTNIITASEIGVGTRLMWIPDKAAFRAGKIDTTVEGSHPEYFHRWDDSNIGDYSVAIGRNAYAPFIDCIAIGENAIAGDTGAILGVHGNIAIGHNVVANGIDAIAMGYACKATRRYTGAFGYQCVADTDFAFAMGYGCISSGASSFAAMRNNKALGNNSLALGSVSLAAGMNSIAIGDSVTANASYTTSIGRKSLANEQGSLTIGEHLTSLHRYGFVIGRGRDDNHRLKSSYSNSLSIGFLSDSATLYVGPGDSTAGSRGKVGIGLTNPANRLDVKGGVAIGSSYAGSISVPTDGLVIEGKTVIGGTAANDSSILTITGNGMSLGGNWWTISDMNLKKDISNFTDGLATIKKINPIRYHFNGKLGIDSTNEHIGILAQDIQKVAPYTVKNTTFTSKKMIKPAEVIEHGHLDSTVHISVDLCGGQANEIISHTYNYVSEFEFIPEVIEEVKSDYLAYNPSALAYLSVNAIKELDASLTSTNILLKIIDSITQTIQQENKTLQTDNLSMSQRINVLEEENVVYKQRIKDLEEKVIQIQSTCCKNAELYDDVLLEQNTPNPFAKETIITYFVPERLSGRIELVIADAGGNSIFQSVAVQTNIPSQYTYSATDLKTGVYLYGISLNGQIIKSKKMMIIK